MNYPSRLSEKLERIEDDLIVITPELEPTSVEPISTRSFRFPSPRVARRESRRLGLQFRDVISVDGLILDYMHKRPAIQDIIGQTAIALSPEV